MYRLAVLGAWVNVPGLPTRGRFDLSAPYPDDVGVSSLPLSRATAISIDWSDDRCVVLAGDRPFCEYRYGKDLPRPFCFPVYGPGNIGMTRRWPMVSDARDEQRDHVHHRSLWFTHGDVNGHDFWSEHKGHGRIVHRGMRRLESGGDEGVIASDNDWIAADGQRICRDRRELRFAETEHGRSIDWNVTLVASDGPVVLGDTKEGTMAIRVHPNLRVEGKVATGTLRNLADDRGKNTWGKRSPWVDNSGEIEGVSVGVAIFDHPSNPRHPTWWHARTYGLVAANPFGLHYFEKKAKGAGDMRIEDGQSLTFRYRFLFHAGDAVKAGVEARYRAYTKLYQQAASKR